MQRGARHRLAADGGRLVVGGERVDGTSTRTRSTSQPALVSMPAQTDSRAAPRRSRRSSTCSVTTSSTRRSRCRTTCRRACPRRSSPTTCARPSDSCRRRGKRLRHRQREHRPERSRDRRSVRRREGNRRRPGGRLATRGSGYMRRSHQHHQLLRGPAARPGSRVRLTEAVALQRMCCVDGPVLDARTHEVRVMDVE